METSLFEVKYRAGYIGTFAHYLLVWGGKNILLQCHFHPSPQGVIAGFFLHKLVEVVTLLGLTHIIIVNTCKYEVVNKY